MKKARFLIAATLFLHCILFTPSVSAAAAVPFTQSIQPLRYQTISVIQSTIELNNGIVTGRGTYAIRLDNPNVTLTVILEESTNTSDWHEADSWVFYRTEKSGGNSGTYSAKKNHYYRTKVILDVSDSKGHYIESGEVYSAIKFYY